MRDVLSIGGFIGGICGEWIPICGGRTGLADVPNAHAPPWSGASAEDVAQ